MLEKIKRDSVPQQVFEILKQEIINGTYPAGSKLPSENELCGILGVSRPSVKAAVRQLCFLGMAETKAGDGTYVRKFNMKDYLGQATDMFFSANDADAREITEFRVRMEIGAALLAIKHGTQEDFCKMDELVDRMDAVYGRDFEEHARLDFQLHHTIAKAAHNRYYLFMFETMSDIIYKYVLEKNEDIFNSPEHNVFGHDIHRDIVEAIKNKDAAACQNIYDRKYLQEDGEDGAKQHL